MDVKKFVERFETVFKLLMDLNCDKRNFTLVKYDDGKGKFSLFNKGGDKYNFSTKYDMKSIEVYYNPNKIEKTYFNPAYNFTKKNYEKSAIYLASHEYGHTFFCDSTYTLKILFEQNYQFLTNLNFLLIVTLFSEFSADKNAYQFFPIAPEVEFSLFFRNIDRYLIEYIQFRIPGIGGVHPALNRYDTYSLEFKELIRFYVFKKWKNAFEPFKRRFLHNFFLLNKLILDFFDYLHNKLSRPIYILKELIALAKILNNISIQEVVLKNSLQHEEKEKLRLLIIKTKTKMK